MKRIARLADPPSRSIALGAAGCLGWSRDHGGLDSLFQKPGLQIPHQLQGLLLYAIE
jgi:hypothetical protein